MRRALEANGGNISRAAEKLSISQPSFMKGAIALMKSVPIETWKAYMTVRLLDAPSCNGMPGDALKVGIGSLGQFVIGHSSCFSVRGRRP